VSLQRELYFIFKNLYDFKGFGADRLVKEFATKAEKKTTLNDF